VQIVVIEMRSCVHHIGQLAWLWNASRIFQCRLIQNPGNYASTKKYRRKPDGIFSSQGKERNTTFIWSFAKRLVIFQGPCFLAPGG